MWHVNYPKMMLMDMVGLQSEIKSDLKYQFGTWTQAWDSEEDTIFNSWTKSNYMISKGPRWIFLSGMWIFSERQTPAFVCLFALSSASLEPLTLSGLEILNAIVFSDSMNKLFIYSTSWTHKASYTSLLPISKEIIYGKSFVH